MLGRVGDAESIGHKVQKSDAWRGTAGSSGLRLFGSIKLAHVQYCLKVAGRKGLFQAKVVEQASWTNRSARDETAVRRDRIQLYLQPLR